jgi:seryl-tRNA synthetase
LIQSAGKTQAQLDQLLAESNALSKEIGKLFAQGKKQDAEEKRSQSIQFRDDAKKLEDKL